MTGGPDDDDERTQFISQPVPPRPRPQAADEDDERTQFMPQPGAPTPAAPPSPAEDDERTQFMAPPAAASPVPPMPSTPEPEEFYTPEILRDGSEDQPTSTGAFIPEQDTPITQSGSFPADADQPTSTGAFPQAEGSTYAAAATAGAALSGAAAASAQQPGTPPAAAPTPAPSAGQPGAGIGVGTIINNNYRIEQVLKSGGMGSVFRGVNIHTDDPVAIKVILPELAEDEKVGLMFKREARTLGQLQDDAIVRYYNYVYDPDLGGYCLVMEFISGVPLSDYTHSHGPITVDAGKVLLRRLAKGLQKAHDQDVVHRDLSPDNVMLPEGIVAEAVLIDFGIAKSNVVKEGTMAGQFAGKFKYVAPEQLGHFGGEIGPRADVYSLALLMAAAVVGKPIDMGSSIVEAVQTRQTIPDLSEVPPDLRPILMHMLEPDPAHRPSSMSQIVDLMDAPEGIPLKYRQGLPLPNTAMPGATTTKTFQPVAQTVQGLQAPPSAMSVGGTTTTGPLPSVEAGSGLGFILPLGLMALLAGTAAAVYFTMGEDIMAGLSGGEPEEQIEEVEEGLTPRAENTREGFLAAFDAGECSYSTRIAAGPDAGMIAGLAPDAGRFVGLPEAYEGQFGTAPAISERMVTEAQCPALDFARALQGRAIEEISLNLDANSVVTGNLITGELADRQERRIWMALISPTGGVFNLTDRVSNSVAGARSFSFGLNLPAGSEAQPQLILAVASEEPLIRTAASRDGAVAQSLLPLILREIESNGGTAVATLAQVMLTPPPPPEPAPEQDDGTTGNDEASEQQ